VFVIRYLEETKESLHGVASLFATVVDDFCVRRRKEMPAQSRTETIQVLPDVDNSTPSSQSLSQISDNTRLESGSEVRAEGRSENTVPDGGLGWMVVFGSFVIHVIVGGIRYTFGVLVEDLVDHFECSKSEVGAVGSLMMGFAYGSGKYPVRDWITDMLTYI